MKKKGIINFFIFITLITIPTLLFAESITINITAEVATVNDMGNTLDGAVEVGDIITGNYTYESTTPDTNSLPTVGDYQHDTSPYGISLKVKGKVNGLVFKTDPDDVDFLVEICNDHGLPTPTDNYLLRSYNNLPLPGGIIVEHISWQLDDSTATALSSESLPTDPPVLEDWQSIGGISIRGFIPDPSFPDNPYLPSPETEYFIRAHVTSATIKHNQNTNCNRNHYQFNFNYNAYPYYPYYPYPYINYYDNDSGVWGIFNQFNNEWNYPISRYFNPYLNMVSNPFLRIPGNISLIPIEALPVYPSEIGRAHV